MTQIAYMCVDGESAIPENEGGVINGVQTYECNGTSSYVVVEPTGLVPPLSAADGALIGASIIGCWLVGLAARYLRKALN